MNPESQSTKTTAEKAGFSFKNTTAEKVSANKCCLVSSEKPQDSTWFAFTLHKCHLTRVKAACEDYAANDIPF